MAQEMPDYHADAILFWQELAAKRYDALTELDKVTLFLQTWWFVLTLCSICIVWVLIKSTHDGLILDLSICFSLSTRPRIDSHTLFQEVVAFRTQRHQIC